MRFLAFQPATPPLEWTSSDSGVTLPLDIRSRLSREGSEDSGSHVLLGGGAYSKVS